MTRPSIRAVLALTALITAAACGGGSKTAPAPGASPAPASGNAAAAKAAPAAKLPKGVTTAMVTLGDSIFNNGSCQRCHGKLGAGAANGPAFKGIAKWQHGSGSYDDIVKTVIAGVPADQIKDATHKFPMGAKGGRSPLTDDQIKAVAAYVFTISR